MEIVLRKSQLKTIIDVAGASTVKSSEDGIISSLRSCADENGLGKMRSAVSNAVGTEIGDLVS